MIPSHLLLLYARSRRLRAGWRPARPHWILDLDGAEPVLAPAAAPDPLDLPYQHRTSAIAPRPGADKVAYVLGKHAEAWWAATAAALAGTAAADRAAWAATRLPDPPPQATDSELVVVRGAGRYLHEHETLAAAWEATRRRTLTCGEGTCAWCGAYAALARTVPAALTGARLGQRHQLPLFPGATGVVCVPCAEDAGAAFDALTGDREHHQLLGGEAIALWWDASGAPTLPLGRLLDQPDPAALKAWTAAKGTINVWLLKGVPGRLSTAGAWSMPTAALAERLGTWYERIRNHRGDHPDVYGINALHRHAAGRYQEQTRTYQVLQRPSALALREGDWWRTAIEGGSLRRHAQAATTAVAADGRWSGAREAILRAHWGAPDTTSAHYQAGQLLRCYRQMEAAATFGVPRVVDRLVDEHALRGRPSAALAAAERAARQWRRRLAATHQGYLARIEAAIADLGATLALPGPHRAGGRELLDFAAGWSAYTEVRDRIG